MTVIYKIENTITSDFYIGSAINFNNRRWSHLHELRNNKHHSPILQNSWNKYGEKVFVFSVVEKIDNKNDLIIREQHYINLLNPRYNISKIAGSPLGVKHTDVARKNMSEAHKGKKLTPESIKKRTLKQSGKNSVHYGKCKSDEIKEKIKIGLKKYFSKNVSHWKGKHRTEEEKRKISESLMIPIYQCDLENNFIKEWKGSAEAAKTLKIKSVNITQCCKGKAKTAGRFIWKYKYDKH